METEKFYTSYPFRTVFLSNLFSLLIYGSGLLIMIRAGWIAAIIFAAFILSLEIRLISRHCVNCYYWGKICGFGKGWVSSLFFKKGDPVRFCQNSFSWKDMIPDLLVSLIPLVAGIILLIIHFSFVVLFALVVLVALSSVGNGFIRGSLTCKFCKQREIGCPAEELFRKGKESKNPEKIRP